MKDKEKQIEEANQLKELAKIIRYVLEDRTDIKYIPDLAFPIAKELLKHYQPKLPEDNVVLSADEFVNLKKYTYKKGSKEAAKEFYDKFNENICCFKLENKSEDYKNGYTQAIADICGKLDKTAIELGVDLKEYYGK